MVQNKIVHVDVAFLTYNPKRCADTPSVRQDNTCIAGFNELRLHRELKRREKQTMNPDAYHHYKWYNSMLMHEMRAASENSKLRIIHWHIESGNTEAFMMGGVLYKAVSIIIGPEMEHWYCANVGKDAAHSYGSRYRNNNQHEKNIQKIACFTIDDNEATLVAQPSCDDLPKCTKEICANNCIECKKFKSAFSENQRHSKCACFPDRDEFKRIEESDLENCDSTDDEDDAPPPVITRQKRFIPRFKLNAIREERFEDSFRHGPSVEEVD